MTSTQITLRKPYGNHVEHLNILKEFRSDTSQLHHSYALFDYRMGIHSGRKCSELRGGGENLSHVKEEKMGS